MMQSQQPEETCSAGAGARAGAVQSPAAGLPTNNEIYATPTRKNQLSSATNQSLQQIPSLMPTTIKVNNAGESKMSSNTPGLGSSMDMSMNPMTENKKLHW